MMAQARQPSAIHTWLNTAMDPCTETTLVLITMVNLLARSRITQVRLLLYLLQCPRLATLQHVKLGAGASAAIAEADLAAQALRLEDTDAGEIGLEMQLQLRLLLGLGQSLPLNTNGRSRKSVNERLENVSLHLEAHGPG
jgi:hypothetical protein